MTKNISAIIPNFDFNKPDSGFFERNVFSNYAPNIAKVAAVLRETLWTIQMNEKVAVRATVVQDENGVGEEYSVHFKSDAVTAAFLTVGIQQTPVDGEDDTTYLTKATALEVFDRFLAQHNGMALVAEDGNSTLEFISPARSLRTVLQLVDDRVCQIACNIDLDENEPALYLSLDYNDPQGLIAISLYAR